MIVQRNTYLTKLKILCCCLFVLIGGSACGQAESNSASVFAILNSKKIQTGNGIFVEQGLAICLASSLQGYPDISIAYENQIFEIGSINAINFHNGLVLFQLKDTLIQNGSWMDIKSHNPRTGENAHLVSVQNGTNSKNKTTLTSVNFIEGYGRAYSIQGTTNAMVQGHPVVSEEGKLIGLATHSLSEDENQSILIESKALTNLLNSVKTMKNRRKGKGRLLNPNDFNDNFMKGIVAYDHNDWLSALYYFSRVLEVDPSDGKAYYHRGVIRGKLDDTQDAFENFNAAVKMAPKFAAAYNSRGAVKLAITDYDGAFEDFNKSLELDHNYQPGYVNRGAGNLKVKEFRLAIKDLTKASKLDETDAEARLLLGIGYFENKDYAEAIIELDEAVELGMEGGEVFFVRGKCKFLSNNLSGACFDWNHASILGENQGLELLEKNCATK